jgi:serine protease DegS/serine protease DegQ
MKTLYRICVFFAQFITLGLAAAFLISVVSPHFVDRVRQAVGTAPVVMSEPSPRPEPPTVTQSAPDHHSSVTPDEHGDEQITASYSAAVSRAAPAVVNIYANKVVDRPVLLQQTNPVLERMFPGIIIGKQKTRQQSLGSGVIVSADGYVVTNNHVIHGAEEIAVVLYDGRVTRARVIGTDAETDLAVLKIDAENLPNIAIADKTPLNVGDVVLALGNPFGLGRTVTMGIVSATGRQLNLSTYEDFIQTDAAINQGNSGGALVNAYGELVGINSDVYSPTGGNIGIGFAIPVGTAKAVLDQIVAHGRVIRGWLGAEYQDVPAAQSGTGTPEVMVRGVYDNGPAAEAGLQAGDVLLTLDGQPITSQLELRNREANLAPGTKVELAGARNGAAFKVAATLRERPQRQTGG